MSSENEDSEISASGLSSTTIASNYNVNDEFIVGVSTSGSKIMVAIRDPVMARIELTILTAMLIVSLLGNGFALLALKLRRRKLSRMHFFFLHLIIADLVVAIFHIFSQLVLDVTGGFPGGFAGDRALCKIVMYMQMLGPYSSAYVLVVTAIDRYQAICFPLSNCSWTPRRSQLMVGAAWLLAGTFDLPQLFVFDYYYGEYGRHDCYSNFGQPWGEKVYVLWVTLAIFVVPFGIIVYTYTCISRVIWTNFRQKSNGAKNVQSENENNEDGGQCGERATGKSGKSDVINGHALVDSAYRSKGKQCKVKVNICHHNNLGSLKNRDQRSLHPRAHSMTGISRAKIKTIKMTIIVVLCYVVCSSPFYTSMLYVTWYPEAREYAFYSSPAFTILALLASLNSCVNPWLYLGFNENLTNTLKDLFRRPSCIGQWRDSSGCHPSNADHVNTFFSRSSLSETRTCVLQPSKIAKHVVIYHHGDVSDEDEDEDKLKLPIVSGGNGTKEVEDDLR